MDAGTCQGEAVSSPVRLIGLKDVMKRTTLPKSTLYKWVAQGTFPKPIKLGERRVAWIELEVEDWIASKCELRGMPVGHA